MNDLEYLRPFATTPQQIELLDAIRDSASHNQAYKKLGRDQGNCRKTLRRLKEKAARQGISPDHDFTKPAPQGFHIKGTSTLYDDAGNLKIQWVKTQADAEKHEENLREYIAGICEDIKPAKPAKLNPQKKYNPDLMSAIFIGDGHLGCYAYDQETRHSNFNTDIASENIRNAVDDLVSRSPNSETGLLVDVGDFMHANTSHNTTWSGTPQDVDTRHHRVMREAGMLMRYCVSRMLQKYKKVIVVVARGNHNPDAAVGVQLMLEFYYSNEDRVNVLPTEGFFHYIEWGELVDRRKSRRQSKTKQTRVSHGP